MMCSNVDIKSIGYTKLCPFCDITSAVQWTVENSISYAARNQAIAVQCCPPNQGGTTIDDCASQSLAPISE